MKKLFLLLFCISLLSGLSVQAQDQHFTQFFAAPLTLNPALSGTFNGKYRVALVYRDQNPYQTYAGAVDLRFGLNNIGKRYKDAFGVGVVFYNDRVPKFGFSNNQINVAGAFHKSLSKKNDQFLSIGFQAGLAQRNFGYERFSFEDQFGGDSGYTNPTSEILPANNFAYGDIATGINYTYSPKRGVSVFAGAAMHHILEPEISFFYNEDEPDLGNSDLLYRKYSAYVNVNIPVGLGIQIQPRALIYAQGPHLAANAGSNIRFLIDEISGVALHTGAWVRPVRDELDNFMLDAVVGMVGIEFSNCLLGLSYDARIDGIGSLRKQRGAFELSLAYLGEYDDEVVLCPKF